MSAHLQAPWGGRPASLSVRQHLLPCGTFRCLHFCPCLLLLSLFAFLPCETGVKWTKWPFEWLKDTVKDSVTNHSVSNFSDTKRLKYFSQPFFFFLCNPQHVSDANRPPSVLACYFHHSPLVSPEHAEMVTDEMVAAKGLVWHRTGQRDEAGHFFPPWEEW